MPKKSLTPRKKDVLSRTKSEHKKEKREDKENQNENENESGAGTGTGTINGTGARTGTINGSRHRKKRRVEVGTSLYTSLDIFPGFRMFDSGTQKDNMFSGVFAPISSSSEYPYPLTIPDPSLFPPYPASLYKYVKHHMPEKADMLVDAIFEVLFYSSSSKKDTSSARGSLHSIQDRQAKAQETEKGVNKEMDIEKCKEWECMACSYIGWRVPEKRKPSCFQGHRCLSSEEDICFRCRCAKRRAQTAQEDPSRTVEQTRDETGISDPKTTEYRKA